MGFGDILKGALSFIPGVGQLAGAILGGRGAGRAEEAKIGLQADQLALQRSGQAKEFEGTNARRMLSSDILAQLQGTKLARPSTWPEMTGGGGGIFDSISPEARASFGQQAGAYRGSMPGAEIPRPEFGGAFGTLAGRSYDKKYPNGQRVGVAGVPNATTMPKPGMADTILSILSGAGQFGSAIGGNLKPRTPAPTPGMTNPQFRPPPGITFGGPRR